MMTGFDWGMGNGGMGAGGWLWIILAVVLLVVIVWAVLSAIPRDRRPVDDAAQILEARFARGEISQEEYEQARRLLGI